MPGFLWAQRPGKWTRFFVHVWQGPQCSSWFSSQSEICEKIQFEQAPFPAPQAEASSRPPESKPDVLIRPKDNKLQLEILSTADHRSMGYKIHSTREILVQMHINAQQISSQVSSNFCVCQFCKAFLHYKLVIWDCLSQNQRLRCPLSPSPQFLSAPELTKTGLFKLVCRRRWLVLARKAGAFPSSEIWSVSSDPGSWVASFTLTFPLCQLIHLPPTHWKIPASSETFKESWPFNSSLFCSANPFLQSLWNS